MVCSDTHDTLKGHCLDKAHVRSCDNIFFTNKNRNTITRATNSPRVSLEFQLPFENLLSADMQRIFFIFMLREGGVC